ncbi:MAG: CpaF family protein [Eggerthellaceae bacterium]|nr:CpaF family protein [Eggerthellaceae bacterium]
MSLLERVKAAGNDGSSQCEEKILSLDLLRDRVQSVLPVETLAFLMRDNPERARNELRSACRQEFSRPEWAAMPADARLQMTEELVDIVFGLGPLECLLADEDVTEIMVNGASNVFYEKYGVIYRSEVSFSDDEQVRTLIDRIIGPLGRRIDESSPMVSARLPQGHRVHAVVPPVALDGPMLSIRVFSPRCMTLDDLRRTGSVEAPLAQFLAWAVRARRNIAVSGGTGSGKTTLLNALSHHISPDERIITIEDSAELRFFDHPHVVRLEARPRNAEGAGEVTIRDLLVSSLRMRP